MTVQKAIRAVTDKHEMTGEQVMQISNSVAGYKRAFETGFSGPSNKANRLS
tara:strand:+ start:899 stop:1051 length:153 start_codon:yes stop_codon:yes gene_type:complete